MTDATAARKVSRKVAAAELGISRQRLEKLIKQGRIREDRDGIDIEQAKADRAKNTDAIRRMAYEESQATVAAAPVATAAAAPAARPATYNVPRGATQHEDGETGQLYDFAGARAARESWNAKIAEAKYRQTMGELISREEVRAKEFNVARLVRDRILGFPSRLANFVTPEAMRMLTDECDALVRELQDAASKIAESDGGEGA